MTILVLDDDHNRLKVFKSQIPNGKQFETAEAVIAGIQGNTPIDVLFLDHDLGGETYVDSAEKNTGMEVVRWIVANKPVINQIIVHSHNHPAGVQMTTELTNAGYKTEYIPFLYLRNKLIEVKEEQEEKG